MYRKTERQIPLENFYQPFGGKLNPENRWIKLSTMIPWDVIEEKYAALFADSGMGAPAKSVRMALGALIIKEKCGFSDEELVEQIRENHYFQYFIGLPEYQDKIPFDPSMMVHFRKRLNAQVMNEINELISLERKPKKTDSDDQDPSGGDASGKNKGQLILDATCAPADIRYPTDCSLLNEAREKLEAMIDTLYEPFRDEMVKPRTYRQKARKDYLNLAKSKRPKPYAIRRAVGKQLRYMKRNFKTIQGLFEKNPDGLSAKQLAELDVIRDLYAQQKTMFDQRTHRIDNRIVSISQPHVRPIVRGKVPSDTEFGAKIAVSLVNGFVLMEKLSWDNFNEGVDLQDSAENYRRRFGVYPAVIIADKLYRNQENFKFCKKHGIHLSGPKLGRPPKDVDKKQRRLERQYERIRNAVEGKFGEAKRCYGLNRITAKLKETSETEIMLQLIVMNLERKLRVLLSLIFERLFGDGQFLVGRFGLTLG